MYPLESGLLGTGCAGARSTTTRVDAAMMATAIRDRLRMVGSGSVVRVKAHGSALYYRVERATHESTNGVFCGQAPRLALVRAGSSRRETQKARDLVPRHDEDIATTRTCGKAGVIR